MPWGALRWCQKTGASSGCFDVRRVMLHELGHGLGLQINAGHGLNLANVQRVAGLPEEGGRRRFAQIFQFNVIASCLVVLLIICVMLGVGGMSLLQWLVEGG